MDAAPVLKRKGAEEAPEPWLAGAPVPAAKIRRLDAEVPPPVAPGAGVPPAPQPFAVEGVLPAAAVANAEQTLKRKGAEAPVPWLDGVPVPATKIRRLDAEVPPVEPGVGVPSPPQPFGVEEVPMSGDLPLPAAAVCVAPVGNDERAIVVYHPAEAARNLLLGPLRPEVRLRVSPDWIHGLKSTMLQEASHHRALFQEVAGRDENPNLAMVPWAGAQAAAAASTASAAETMEAEDGDGASMEVEQDGAGQPAPQAGVASQGEAFHQQQQQWPPQHCVPPQQMQLPAASYQPSAVTWSW